METINLSRDYILRSFPISTQNSYLKKHSNLSIGDVTYLDLVEELARINGDELTDHRISFKQPVGYEDYSFLEMITLLHSINPEQSKSMMDKVKSRDLTKIIYLLGEIPFKLPPSFLQYLSQVGIFEKGSQMFSGITSDETAQDDVMLLTNELRKYCNLPESMFVFSDDETSPFCYCLHPDSADKEGECPVFLFDK